MADSNALLTMNSAYLDSGSRSLVHKRIPECRQRANTDKPLPVKQSIWRPHVALGPNLKSPVDLLSLVFGRHLVNTNAVTEWVKIPT